MSSTSIVLGALASRSRLAVGQRREGSRERVELSDARQALRRLRRWVCSWLTCSAVIRGGLWIGDAVRPSRRACWRPRPSRCNPVCPRPGTSERVAVGLMARWMRAASGITKKGGRRWRRASFSRNRKRLWSIARLHPSRFLAPFMERYAVSKFGSVYRTSSSREHSSATHAVRPKAWSR
jgi:hypothetical protein